MNQPLQADDIRKRSAGATCAAMYAFAPDGEFKTALEHFQRECFIELPEDGDRWWRRLSLIMQQHVNPDSDVQWQKDVCAIWFQR